MKKKSAFTLIEVVVVVSIIALISSVVFFSLSGSQQKERDAKKIADVLQLQTALENYKRAEGVYPSTITLGQPLVGSTTGITFLSKVPEASIGEDCGVDQYSYSYSSTTKEYSFSFCINNDLEDYTAGVYYATPRGIEKAPPVCGDSDYVLTDIDGNTYTTTKIGTQCFMAQNLKTTKYNDGTSIPNITDDTAWSADTTGAYSWWQNNIANKNSHGGFYNFYAGATGKLCPTGWKVPTYTEITTLRTYLMSNSQYLCNPAITTTFAKSLAATSGWGSSSVTCAVANNQSINNYSNFNALPIGLRLGSGSFSWINHKTLFLLSTATGDISNWFLNIQYDNAGDYFVSNWLKAGGASVRCLKE